jgi:hypothetical protein
MPDRRVIRLLMTLMLTGSILGACRSAEPPDASPTGPASPPTPRGQRPNVERLPKCDFPPEVPFPDWVPEGLPLPPGTYAYDNLPRQLGYYRGLFVLPGMLTEKFARYALRKWPAAGFQLGRGDQEPGEVEGAFLRPPASGAFKAQDVFCRELHSLLLLLWTPTQPKQPPAAQPQSPLPGRSPQPSPS